MVSFCHFDRFLLESASPPFRRCPNDAKSRKSPHHPTPSKKCTFSIAPTPAQNAQNQRVE